MVEVKSDCIITSASFLVTEDCNLACEYCFEKEHNARYMSKKVAKRALDLLCEGGIKNGNTGFHAMIFGGEPLMNPSLIEYIFDYGYKLGKKNSNPFTASIVTNATIANKEVLDILERYKDKVNLNVQLSVDGVKEVHDRYRVTKAGKGSFDMIEGNIDKFKELFKDNPKNLSIHGCLNRESLPRLFDSYKFFREDWGFESIWFMPVHEESWESEDVSIYKDELSKISDYIIKKSKDEDSSEELQNYAPINKCLAPNVRANAPCGAGKSFVSITAKGDIYPCHHFYFNDDIEETIIGDVFNGIDNGKRRLFMDYTDADMSCPSTCEHNHCYRCIGVNWVENGSIFAQVRGNYCEMSKMEKVVADRTYEELDSAGLIEHEEFRQGDYNEIFARAIEIILLEINDVKQQQEEILSILKG